MWFLYFSYCLTHLIVYIMCWYLLCVAGSFVSDGILSVGASNVTGGIDRVVGGTGFCM